MAEHPSRALTRLSPSHGLSSRRRGRPRKVPTPTALNPFAPQQFDILQYLARDRLQALKPHFAHLPAVWGQLQARLLHRGTKELIQLCRRYDPASCGEPASYLWRRLPARTAKPFERMIRAALDEADAGRQVRLPPEALRPPAPTGRKRSDIGTWVAFAEPSAADVAIYAYKGYGGMEAREIESRVLAVLADDPVAIDIYIRAKAARLAWTAACERFRQQVAKLKLPAGATTTDLATIINALGAAAGARQEDPS